ncbi:MAG: TrkA C-terminal domain-containing protein [Desulfobacterales bacterium]
MSIFARASSKGVEKKLFRAGANYVVSPYASAALRITQNILRPTITDFLDSTISGKEIELAIEELEIPETATFVGKSMMDANIRNEFDLIIVAIKRADGTRIYNPSSLELIHAGDTLVFVGRKPISINSLKKFMGRAGIQKTRRQRSHVRIDRAV